MLPTPLPLLPPRVDKAMNRRHQRLLLAGLLPVEVVLATFAWRDLAQRSDDQIRGPRSFWRVFVLINPGNSIVYWLIGRR